MDAPSVPNSTPGTKSFSIRKNSQAKGKEMKWLDGTKTANKKSKSV
jgi:hypothetical protein